MAGREEPVRLSKLSGQMFLQFIRHAATSRDVGRISTQFEAELRDDLDDVGALGLWACGVPVGAASYALIPLRFRQSSWSGRIDVVATLPAARGHGVAGVLMAALVLELHERLGERWTHVSVVAIHPAIEHLALHYGLERIEGGDTPLYFKDLDDARRAALRARGAREYARLRADLAVRCRRCERFATAEPWCRSADRRKPG